MGVSTLWDIKFLPPLHWRGPEENSINDSAPCCKITPGALSPTPGECQIMRIQARFTYKTTFVWGETK